jgi:hypothetical protein
LELFAKTYYYCQIKKDEIDRACSMLTLQFWYIENFGVRKWGTEKAKGSSMV